jgi:ATP synthase protein I
VAQKEISTISKILAYQLLIIIIIFSSFALARGWHEAYSAGLGGAAAFIPNAYLAVRIFRTAGQEPRKMVTSFYVGETGKLLLTALLFLLIFQIPTIEILPLLAGYLAALSVFWFALLLR